MGSGSENMGAPGPGSGIRPRHSAPHPRGVIRTIIYCPFPMGSNSDELIRVVQAPKTADAIAAPEDWRPGEDVIAPTAGSWGVAHNAWLAGRRE